MSTRFYLPSADVPPGAPASPAVGSMWEVTSVNFARRAMHTVPADTSLSASATTAGTENATAALQDVLLRQYVSKTTLPAKTITGTVSLVIRALSTTGGGAADHYTQLRIAVVSGDGATLRGELFAGQVATTVSAVAGDPNAEWPSGAGAQVTRVVSGLVLTPVTVNDGDRLVAELGYRACNVVATAYTGQMYFGDEAAVADYALTAGLATVLRPWLEFSDDVFVVPVPPGPDTSTLTWDQITCFGSPTPVQGRWVDVPATLRWDQVATTVLWDQWTGL